MGGTQLATRPIKLRQRLFDLAFLVDQLRDLERDSAGILIARFSVEQRLRGPQMLQRVFESPKSGADVAGGAQVTMEATFEVEGAAKPSCVAEIIFRYYK